MAATQSQTAVVTDIRKIEMRRFDVPEPGQNDAVLNELSEKIPAAKTANPTDFTDTRFLDELERSGYFEQISK